MVDIHCHILPLDDGATDWVQAIAMARLAQAKGTTDIVATPHFEINRESIDDYLEARDKCIVYFRELFKDADVQINVYAASELMLHPFIVDLPLNRFAIANKYLLVELPRTSLPSWFKDVLFGLEIKGFVPILAHPERSVELMKDLELLAQLVEQGLLLQINAMSVVRKDREYKNVCKLISKGLVCTIASDAHSTNIRIPDLSQAYDRIKKLYGIEYVNKLQQNARAIISGQSTEKALPTRSGIFSRRIKG